MNTKIINKLKEETNNSSYIVYREKYINNIKIDIIYNEVLTTQAHPVPGRASLPRLWVMRPARRAYGHTMRMPQNLWARSRWQR